MNELHSSDKATHHSVHYVDPSPHPEHRCGNCAHFIKGEPNRCETVKLPIAKAAWCQRYETDAKKSGMRG